MEGRHRLQQALGTDSLVELYDRLASSTVPGWVRELADEERKSKVLRRFELAVVDGLLQTPEYANVILGGDENALRLRMERQALLGSDDPPTSHCVMDESVLRREIGGREVMSAQLEHLVAMISPKISI